MTALSGTLYLDRAILSEVVEDPNVVPRVIVAGTASGIGGGLGKPDDIAQTGSFRSYGNGNTRMILGAGQSRTQTLALRALTPAQVQTVKDLVGHTVCYRDTYGRRVFGGFLTPQIVNIAFSGGLADIGLVIQSVTYVEAV